jgi:hypothetical protein
MLILGNKAGVMVVVDDERGLLINGKPPERLEALGDDWYKASSVFCRGKRPKKVAGARKRKRALMVAVRRHRFSMNFKKG